MIITHQYCRLVKEVQTYHFRREYRWQANAMLALQEAAEAHLVVSCIYFVRNKKSMIINA